uniref:Leukocyte surface antigen CD47 n=1 Tax=Salvator merianae TaxID=96440 RepID=A0A8D0B9W7_SALMN
MWALGVWWVLLGTLGTGFAQLQFQKVDSVIVDSCNTSDIILPCVVTNLKENNEKSMFVKWKIHGRDFFSYDGYEKKFNRNSTFQSANLLNLEKFRFGIASLKLSKKEALPGNYTCEVVESHREGDTIVELIYTSGNSCRTEPTFPKVCQGTSWFESLENFFIIATIILAAVLFWLQFGIVVLKFDTTLQKKIGLSAAGIIVTFAAVIGSIIFMPAGYTASNQAGLGLIVIPAGILVPLLYFLFRSVFEKQPLFAVILLALKTLGYLIAVTGFALCVSACPPKHGSVMIAGLAIIDFVAAVGLIYISIIGSSFKDHQPPRVSLKFMHLG